MKKLSIFLVLILSLAVFSSCSKKDITIEDFEADSADIFSSNEMNVIAGLDSETTNDIKSLLVGQVLVKTDDEFDEESSFIITFYNKGEDSKKLIFDKNSVFFIEDGNYASKDGSFDYSKVAEIYDKLADASLEGEIIKDEEIILDKDTDSPEKPEESKEESSEAEQPVSEAPEKSTEETTGGSAKGVVYAQYPKDEEWTEPAESRKGTEEELSSVSSFLSSVPSSSVSVSAVVIPNDYKKDLELSDEDYLSLLTMISSLKPRLITDEEYMNPYTGGGYILNIKNAEKKIGVSFGGWFVVRDFATNINMVFIPEDESAFYAINDFLTEKMNAANS